MKLSTAATATLLEAAVSAHQQTLAESGYARTYSFDYPAWHRDPKPDVMVLGHYHNPNTDNDLLGGINLHYLTTDELSQLRKALPKILKTRRLRSRYRTGNHILPGIFSKAYRTYKKDLINAVDPSTLRFWHPKADKRREELEKRRKKQDQRAKRKEAEKERRKQRQLRASPPSRRHERDSEIDDLQDKAETGAKQRVQRDIEDRPDDLNAVRQQWQSQMRKHPKSQKRQKPEPTEPEELEEPDEDLGLGEGYIRAHHPAHYRAAPGLQLVAAYNQQTKQLIVDDCFGGEMVARAGWNFDDVTIFEHQGGQIRATGNLNEDVIRAFGTSKTSRLLLG